MSEPDDEVELGGESPDFVWFAADCDEQRRAFIFKLMANPEIDAAILVQNMHKVETWLRSGTVPTERPRGKLHAVKE
jgi:hypothetical protein